MKQTVLLRTISEVRAIVAQAKAAGKKIGLVPTMGALHPGHVSLIEAAAAQTDFVIVTVFVNPTQFGPNEDYDRYPRMLDSDLGMCQQSGADAVFAPTVNEIYPQEQMTWVNVEKITEVLCGASRPGHFKGVATICAKLFNIANPDKAFFGQKDAQQVIVIKRMVSDLNMPLQIVVCPIIREPSGLARSSRNQYLSDSDRREALALYRSLLKAEELIKSGVRQCRKIIAEMRHVLEESGMIRIEYIDIVGAENLEELDQVQGKVLVAVAAHIGATRLIDNIIVDAG